MKNCFCNFDSLKKALNENEAKTEKALDGFFLTKSQTGALNIIYEAQRYSLLGGGKRIRPFLVNEVCRMLGGSIDASMPYAMAVEMIHTYSLIHDDLPCMDDDDLRRGKPTNHKVFGYANALLAGDALLMRAFETVATADVSDSAIRRAVAALASSSGDFGMIGGQIMDVNNKVNEGTDIEKLKKLHRKKTGALISCSVLLGCIAADVEWNDERTAAAMKYAENIGLTFQIIDDILDVVGNEGTLGKNIGSDAEMGKTTFMSYYSVEEARGLAAELTDEAVKAIADFDTSRVLTDFAIFLLKRDH